MDFDLDGINGDDGWIGRFVFFVEPTQRGEAVVAVDQAVLLSCCSVVSQPAVGNAAYKADSHLRTQPTLRLDALEDGVDAVGVQGTADRRVLKVGNGDGKPAYLRLREYPGEDITILGASRWHADC